MGIKPKFSRADIRKEILSKWAVHDQNIFGIIAYVGEDFVTKAKSSLNIDPGAYPKGDYTDRTANLRGSIGYFILRNGRVTRKHLEGTSEGQNAANSLIHSVQRLRKGYQLIGVAGMEYASYLEAMGYNVISSQAEVALVDLSRMLKTYASRKGFDFDIGASSVKTVMR